MPEVARPASASAASGSPPPAALGYHMLVKTIRLGPLGLLDDPVSGSLRHL